MKENPSERRFKTAGARILRSKKLPRDFFRNYHSTPDNPNHALNPSISLHHSLQQTHKLNPPIMEFTFMAKDFSSLTNNKSGNLLASKHQLPNIRQRTVEK